MPYENRRWKTEMEIVILFHNQSCHQGMVWKCQVESKTNKITDNDAQLKLIYQSLLIQTDFNQQKRNLILFLRHQTQLYWD